MKTKYKLLIEYATATLCGGKEKWDNLHTHITENCIKNAIKDVPDIAKTVEETGHAKLTIPFQMADGFYCITAKPADIPPAFKSLNAAFTKHNLKINALSYKVGPAPSAINASLLEVLTVELRAL